MPALPVRRSSMWEAPQIERFLHETAIPLRLAGLSAPEQPLICSLWFEYRDGLLWCATPADAWLVKQLAAHDRCAFEVAGDRMPYRGVRGQGRVTLDATQGGVALGRLIDRYLGSRDSDFAQWLLSRADEEVAILIEPAWLTAWDFSSRMTIGQ